MATVPKKIGWGNAKLNKLAEILEGIADDLAALKASHDAVIDAAVASTGAGDALATALAALTKPAVSTVKES